MKSTLRHVRCPQHGVTSTRAPGEVCGEPINLHWLLHCGDCNHKAPYWTIYSTCPQCGSSNVTNTETHDGICQEVLVLIG